MLLDAGWNVAGPLFRLCAEPPQLWIKVIVCVALNVEGHVKGGDRSLFKFPWLWMYSPGHEGVV